MTFFGPLTFQLFALRWHIICPWLVVIRGIYLRQYWKCLYSLLYFSSLLSCACPGAFSKSQFTRIEKMFNPAFWGCPFVEKIWPCKCFVEETWMAFYSVSDPAPMSAYIVSALLKQKTQYTAKSTNPIWQKITLWDQNCSLFHSFAHPEIFCSKETYTGPNFVFAQTDGYYGFKKQTFQYLLDNDWLA